MGNAWGGSRTQCAGPWASRIRQAWPPTRPRPRRRTPEADRRSRPHRATPGRCRAHRADPSAGDLASARCAEPLVWPRRDRESPLPSTARGRRRCGTHRRRHRTRTAGRPGALREHRRCPSSGRVALMSNRCRYHSPSARSTRVHAVPPKSDFQSLGGSSPAAPFPGSEVEAGSFGGPRRRLPGPPGTRRARRTV